MEGRNKRQKTGINNDKGFIKDGLSSAEIRKTAQYIRQYLEKQGEASYENKVEYLKSNHKLFAERYPMLFEMCLTQEFSFSDLDYFLNMRERVLNDQVSMEKASEQIGQEWFDKYVDLSKHEKK